MTSPAPSGPSAAPTSARRGFWTVAAVLGLFLTAASAPSPLYGTYAARWHFGPTTITAIFAVYAIALLAVLLTAGSLSDSIGRRPVIVTALLIESASMLVFLLANGVIWLYAARILQGVATGLVLAAVAAALIDLEPPARPSLGPLINSIVPTLGLAAGALAAGGAGPVRSGSAAPDLCPAAGRVPRARRRDRGPARLRRPRAPVSFRPRVNLAGHPAGVLDHAAVPGGRLGPRRPVPLPRSFADPGSQRFRQRAAGRQHRDRPVHRRRGGLLRLPRLAGGQDDAYRVPAPAGRPGCHHHRHRRRQHRSALRRHHHRRSRVRLGLPRRLPLAGRAGQPRWPGWPDCRHLYRVLPGLLVARDRRGRAHLPPRFAAYHYRLRCRRRRPGPGLAHRYRSPWPGCARRTSPRPASRRPRPLQPVMASVPRRQKDSCGSPWAWRVKPARAASAAAAHRAGPPP